MGGDIIIQVDGDITAELIESQVVNPEAYGIHFIHPMEDVCLAGTTKITAKNIKSADIGIDFDGICYYAPADVVVEETIHATNYGVLERNSLCISRARGRGAPPVSELTG